MNLDHFSPASFFWSLAGALLTTPVIAYFADRQIAAACCENGSDYFGMLMLAVILIPPAVLMLSPVMIVGSEIVHAAVGSERPQRVVLLLVFFGSLIGAAMAYGAFASFPPMLEETAYPGANGIVPGALTGALVAAGWWWGIRRDELDRHASNSEVHDA